MPPHMIPLPDSTVLLRQYKYSHTDVPSICSDLKPLLIREVKSLAMISIDYCSIFML
jgi:hypothetical protein